MTESAARQEKLQKITDLASKNGIAKVGAWVPIVPNNDYDWINQRDPAFQRFQMLASKDRGVGPTVFETSSFGVVTNRDAWVYNMSRGQLESNVRRLVANYGEERKKYEEVCANEPKDKRPKVEEVVDSDPKRISWTRSLKADVTRGKTLGFLSAAIVRALYRPFTKQWMYFDRRLNEMVSLVPRIFPTELHPNVAVCTTGVGARDAFGVLIANALPDMHMADKSGATQCFPLYLYEKAEEGQKLEFGDAEVVDGYHRRAAITDAIHKKFRDAYTPEVTKEDIFYYVYGILHSPEYRRRFAADLKKMLPRIPLTKLSKDFRAFSKAGRGLAHWHLNYETVEPYPVVEHCNTLALNVEELFKVQKMTFGRAAKAIDKTTIVYNSNVTLSNIPLEAYDYVVNGKPAIAWIMERYQITRDKDSGIVNNPNDWAREHNEPRYIIDLVKRIVRVSLETMKIVATLPALNEIKE